MILNRYLGNVYKVFMARQGVSDEFRPLSLDPATNALKAINCVQASTHNSKHFFCTHSATLNTAGTQVYLLTVPDSQRWPHLIFQVTGSAITQVDLYEGTNRGGATSITVFNSNRNSSKTAGMTVGHTTTTGDSDGTLIWTRKSGSASQQSRSGLETSHDSEIILMQDTKYLIRVTSSTDSNLTNLLLEWFEHLDVTR